MTYPEERIFIFPLPVPIKGKWFVCIYAAVELFSALGTSNDNIAHIAHLGGMVVGYIIIRYWKYQYAHQNTFRGWDGYEVGGKQSLADRIRGWWDKAQMERRRKKQQHDYRHNPMNDEDAKEKQRQQEIDRILDKIKKSGYDSLTAEERQKLFDRK